MCTYIHKNVIMYLFYFLCRLHWRDASFLFLAVFYINVSHLRTLHTIHGYCPVVLLTLLNSLSISNFCSVENNTSKMYVISLLKIPLFSTIHVLPMWIHDLWSETCPAWCLIILQHFVSKLYMLQGSAWIRPIFSESAMCWPGQAWCIATLYTCWSIFTYGKCLYP